VVLGIFCHGADHRVHSLLDLGDLRMDFLDEVVFDSGQLFNAFALLAKLIQEGVLFV